MPRAVLLAFGLIALAFPAPARDDATYEIKLKKEAAGDHTKTVSTDAGDVRFRLEVMGQELDKGEKKTVRQTFTEEILEKPAGTKKPTKLKRTYDVAGKTTDGKKKTEVYEGRTVVIEKKGDKYVFTADGKELTGDDAEELEAEFNKHDDIPLDDEDLMPDKPVAVGGTWTVDPKKLAAAFEQGGPFALDAARTKATGKLVKVYDKAGKRFGVIELTMTLAVKELKIDNQELPMKPGSKVTATTTYDLCIDGSAHSGTEKSSLTFDLHGEVPNGTIAVTGTAKLDKTIEDLGKK
jgi:hypothetical protein